MHSPRDERRVVTKFVHKKPHRGIEPTVRFLDLLSCRRDRVAWDRVELDRVELDRVELDRRLWRLFWA